METKLEMQNQTPNHFSKKNKNKQIKITQVFIISYFNLLFIQNLNNHQGEFKYQDKQKASVPLRNEKPLMNLQSNKNFVVLNAVDNILSGNLNINIKLFII